MSGSIVIKKDNAGVSVNDTTVDHQVSLASNDGTAGIYDNTHNKWIIKSDETGNVTMSGTASKASSATSATYSSTANYAKKAPDYLPLSGGTVSGDTKFNANIRVTQNYDVETYRIIEPVNNRGCVELGQHVYIYSAMNCLFFSGVNPDSTTATPALRTDIDDTVNLGNNNQRWKNVYAKNGTIQTSDRNAKKDFANFDSRHEKFFMMLLPQTYKFINSTSGRTHFGFISQDVEEALAKCGLTDLDFAGFCKDIKTKPVYEEVYNEVTDKTRKRFIRDENVYDDNGNPVYIYSLRYDEFIALVVYMLQKLYSEHETLKAEVSNIKIRLEKLEQQ